MIYIASKVKRTCAYKPRFEYHIIACLKATFPVELPRYTGYFQSTSMYVKSTD